MAIDWLKRFPTLAALDDPAWRRALDAARIATLAPGTVTFRAGDMCENYLMVVEGAVRVQKVSESGREIVLYRVERGQTCVLTTSCLLSSERYPAEGVVETEVRVVVLPVPVFEQLLAESEGFRRFVFSSFGERISDLMMLVEEIAFGQLDRRLAQRLLALEADGRVAVTHHQLAAELGSAREVISRLLKEFERQGLIALARGQIELVDRSALEHLRAR